MLLTMIINKIQEFHIHLFQITFGTSLEILAINYIFLKSFKSEFQAIRVWFTDQNSQPLEID